MKGFSRTLNHSITSPRTFFGVIQKRIDLKSHTIASYSFQHLNDRCHIEANYLLQVKIYAQPNDQIPLACIILKIFHPNCETGIVLFLYVNSKSFSVIIRMITIHIFLIKTPKILFPKLFLDPIIQEVELKSSVYI